VRWRVMSGEWDGMKIEERSRSLRGGRDDSERAEEGGPQDPGSNYEGWGTRAESRKGKAENPCAKSGLSDWRWWRLWVFLGSTFQGADVPPARDDGDQDSDFCGHFAPHLRIASTSD
jgi:hypothetical protein